MKAFEYTVLEVPVTGWFWGGRVDAKALAYKLNQLGKEGWKVVTASETNIWRGSSLNLLVILQREIL